MVLALLLTKARPGHNTNTGFIQQCQGIESIGLLARFLRGLDRLGRKMDLRVEIQGPWRIHARCSWELVQPLRHDGGALSERRMNRVRFLLPQRITFVVWLGR